MTAPVRIDETAEINFVKYHGDSFSIRFALKYKSNQLPVDITLATIKVTVGTLTEASSGVTVTNGGTTGIVNIFIPDTTMDDLTAGTTYDVEVQLSYASGVRYTVFSGSLELLEDVIT